MSESKNKEDFFQRQDGGVAVSEEPREERTSELAAPSLETVEREPADEDLDLQALLKTAEDIINTPPPRDPKEIDEKAARYEQLEQRLEVLPDINESRLARLKRIEEKWREEMAARRKNEEFTGTGYEQFAESARGKSLLGNLQKVEGVIAKMEGEKRDDSGFARILEKLRGKRDSLIEIAADVVFASAEEAFEERIGTVRARANEFYAKRAIELAAQVEELTKDPEVMKRHAERLTEAEAREEAKRKETEEKSARERIVADIDLLNETFLVAASLVNRQKDALARIKEIAGETSDAQKVRDAVADAIILGKGKRQITSPREIAPWKQYFRAAPYLESLSAVRERGIIAVPSIGSASYFDHLIYASDSDKQRGVTDEISKKAHKTVDMISEADANDQKLRDLLGREWETIRVRDQKTGETRELRRQTPLFAAFEKRRQNDAKGETERLRQARIAEEKRRKAEGAKAAERAKVLEAEIQKLRDLADEHAAVFAVPGGAALLEAKKSKKGNTYIEVVDATGRGEQTKVKKGSAFPHYSNMPEWLARAAGSEFNKAARLKLDAALDSLRR